MAQDQNLLLQLEELRAENRRLRQLLAEHGIPFEERKPAAAETAVHEAAAPGKARLSTREKMSLFRSLFCGREDVFAKRWHSMKDGREGYQPVCANEWRPGVCSKKKYSCAVCPFRQLLPLSDRDIYFHLKGADEFCRDVVGVYAIFPDDTCRFLCTDFDDKSSEHGYRDDVIAFTGVCRDWGIPCSVERSRSGRGAHVWILFEKNIPAAKARRLGDAILTEAMNRSGRMSFKSYDRFFPNQDRMPEGGFGNLVALPLQGKARRSGNSVFVDENFEMYPDQWGYLLSVRKMSEAAADAILAMHSAGADLFGAESRQPEESPQQEKKPLPGKRPLRMTFRKQRSRRASPSQGQTGSIFPWAASRRRQLPASAASHPSKTRNSTAGRPCASRPGISRGSSPARNWMKTILPSREDAERPRPASSVAMKPR